MFTKFKCCCLLIVCIPIIYGYTETAQSFSEQLRALYRTKNTKELQKRLMPLKQEKPVFDDLFGTETGDRYYALGKLLKSYYDDQDSVEPRPSVDDCRVYAVFGADKRKNTAGTKQQRQKD